MNTTLSILAMAVGLLSGAASAANRTIYGDGAWTIRVENVDPASAADRARVVGAIRAAGLDACREEPTRAGRAACAEEFAAAAIGDMARPELRTALLHTLTSGGAVAVAEVK